MRNKKIIVTMAGLASIGVLAIGGLTNSHAQYTGVRAITLQSDKVLQLASGKYSGVVPKDGYYVVQMRGGDGATNTSGTGWDFKTHQGGEGGYVEAIYKLNRGQTISANVGTAGTNGTGTADTQGSNADTNDAKGGKGGFSVTFGSGWLQTTVTAKASGGGGSSDFRVDGTRVAAAGGGGGAAGGSSLANGAGDGGSGGYLFANTISPSGFNGEDGNGSTNTSLAGTGATITGAGQPGTTATTYPVWATYAGGPGNGANGGSAGVPNEAYTYTPTAGGGGGAGWFGGGGGNAALGKNSTSANEIAKRSGGGGGGSTNAISAVMTNIDPILTTIKQNSGPDLTSFRPSNVTAGAHLGGGSDKAGKAQIYYIGETLPGTDNVGLYSVPMSEPKGSK